MRRAARGRVQARGGRWRAQGSCAQSSVPRSVRYFCATGQASTNAGSGASGWAKGWGRMQSNGSMDTTGRTSGQGGALEQVTDSRAELIEGGGQMRYHRGVSDSGRRVGWHHHPTAIGAPAHIKQYVSHGRTRRRRFQHGRRERPKSYVLSRYPPNTTATMQPAEHFGLPSNLPLAATRK